MGNGTVPERESVPFTTRPDVTSDGVEITPGLWVWTNDLARGQVHHLAYAEDVRRDGELVLDADGNRQANGWYEVWCEGGARSRSLQNGERLSTVHPFTREPAQQRPSRTGNVSESELVKRARAVRLAMDRTRVTVVGDDSPSPLVGTVIRWESAEYVTVVWDGDDREFTEAADQLTPRRV